REPALAARAREARRGADRRPAGRPRPSERRVRDRARRMVNIDPATGSLLIGGAKVFPLILSNGPPPAGSAPSGANALAEVADSGVNMLRTGNAGWSLELVQGQIAAERSVLDAAHAHGLYGWTWLGNVPNLPTAPGSADEQLLVQIVSGLEAHPGLAAWKGI